jgi:hypothetical protein
LALDRCTHELAKRSNPRQISFFCAGLTKPLEEALRRRAVHDRPENPVCIPDGDRRLGLPKPYDEALVIERRDATYPFADDNDGIAGAVLGWHVGVAITAGRPGVHTEEKSQCRDFVRSLRC